MATVTSEPGKDVLASLPNEAPLMDVEDRVMDTEVHPVTSMVEKPDPLPEPDTIKVNGHSESHPPTADTDEIKSEEPPSQPHIDEKEAPVSQEKAIEEDDPPAHSTRGRRMCAVVKPRRAESIKEIAPRPAVAEAAHKPSTPKSRKPRKRWRTSEMAEEYVNMTGRLMYPSISFGPFGHDPKAGRHPIECPSALGYFTHPLRRPMVIEKWSPFEIAKFEGAIALYGKAFHRIQKAVQSKTTKEIVEFYYIWKKTSHYGAWKAAYQPEFTIVDDSKEEPEPEPEDDPADSEEGKKRGRKRRRG